MKQTLNGIWKLKSSRYEINADVPGSYCNALLREKLIEDPYYRLNEYKTLPIFDDDVTYEREFDVEESVFSADKKLLRFYGIDTLSEVTLNGEIILRSDNMHRTYTLDVTELLKEKGNELKVKIFSPTKYIAEKNKDTKLWGVSSTMAGYPHLRKAHYMFGWDWGPMLPDMGIWRDVELIGIKSAGIESIYVRQDHSRLYAGEVDLYLEIKAEKLVKNDIYVSAEVSHEGKLAAFVEGIIDEETDLKLVINDAKLWYPNGYGEQNLYGLTVKLTDKNGILLDEKSMEIGLRTVTVSREKLKHENGSDNGEEFAFVVNGLKIFAMGANYIPEDQILPRRSRENAEKLIKACVNSNYNMIRVWGGGIYPDDYFYELCDKYGLLVWQDCMFACSAYRADDEFCENVRAEVLDNAERIRNHASLAMYCGNNEMESMWQYWGLPEEQHHYEQDYLKLFEEVIPKALKEADPDTYYWPSSPSSGGGYDGSGDEHRGDQHYWAVWHSLKPFEDYYDHEFRFCSEFGFESLPNIKTIRSFAVRKDMNLCSPVMEAHQKCERGTEKIMYYLAQMSRYPYTFEGLIYATQMVQSDAIRINVENMRRNRGVSMGSLYWQVNDTNPVISWASIDYFMRRKPLHYAAKRFYAPALLSAAEGDMENIRLNVSTERQKAFDAEIVWHSRKNTGEIIAEGSKKITVKPMSAEYFLTLSSAETGITKENRNEAYIEYALIENEKVISANTLLLVTPKQFDFLAPGITYKVEEEENCFKINISSKAYAKGVWLDLEKADCVFSDNFFDLHADDTEIYVDKTTLSEQLTLEEFEKQLSIVSYYEALY